MTDANHNPSPKLAWIEPTIIALDVRETAGNPMTGGDAVVYGGRMYYPDCTRS